MVDRSGVLFEDVRGKDGTWLKAEEWYVVVGHNGIVGCPLLRWDNVRRICDRDCGIGGA